MEKKAGGIGVGGGEYLMIPPGLKKAGWNKSVPPVFGSPSPPRFGPFLASTGGNVKKWGKTLYLAKIFLIFGKYQEFLESPPLERGGNEF